MLAGLFRIRAGIERGLTALVTALALNACVAAPEAPRPAPEPAAPTTEAAPQAPSTRIGSGAVKVALIVPLTGNGASIGTALRNAAELAYEDFQKPDLTILVKDDRGSPDGAREAAQTALNEGADLILGPLFASNVSAVSGTMRGAGKPVVAFSTDTAVAARGVYLISFLPQSEVDRIVEHTAAAGRRSFAALIPETAYGNAVEAEFREAVARRGGRVVALERYAPGDPSPALKRLSGVILGPSAQADALFSPGAPEQLSLVGQALARAGFSPGRVKPVGTALWNDPRVLGLPALQGGTYAAPESAGFASFSQRYQTRFGAPPPRVASLGYDAISLTLALRRQYGTQAFTETSLTNPAGFAGMDGIFRFRPDGTSERALAVYEIRDGVAVPMSPAPKSLGASGL